MSKKLRSTWNINAGCNYLLFSKRKITNPECYQDKRKYSNSQETIYNPCGIQMISNDLHKQLFTKSMYRSKVSNHSLDKIEKHLTAHNLWGRVAPAQPNVDLTLPVLCGEDLAEHFHNIAEKQCKVYSDNLTQLISKTVPSIPKVWNFSPGWTRYDSESNFTIVDYPDEDAYVFDVEVCVTEGHLPTLATAVSNNYWYSWCSDQLHEQKVSGSNTKDMDTCYTLKDLINLETKASQNQLPLKDQKERIVIGHNVGYDRARVKEQYFISNTKLRFLDTMAMHIAISGMTNYQKNILQSGRSYVSDENHTNRTRYQTEEILKWQNVTTTNGLAAVHKFYYGGKELDKQKRNIFVVGSLSEIRQDFQNLVTYCAGDTLATYQVLQKLVPQYLSRFPHPATLAGVMEASTVYLPVNQNWQRYLRLSEETYCELKNDLSQNWTREANRTCHLLKDKSYEKDPWLWDLDWTVPSLKVKKLSKQAAAKNQPSRNDASTEDQFQSLMESKKQLYKVNPVLAGYPNWYRSLVKAQDEANGLFEFSSSARIVPKLLKLTWNGYPLFHSPEFGWGYLVPGRPLEYSQHCSEFGASFPLKNALKLFPVDAVHYEKKQKRNRGIVTVEEAMDKLRIMTSETSDQLSLATLWQAARAEHKFSKAKKTSAKVKKVANFDRVTADQPAWHQGIGPYDVGIPGCWFFRLPRKINEDANVGSPLTKDFMDKIDEGVLQSASSSTGNRILQLYRMIKRWQSVRDRIVSQMVVRLDRSQLPSYVSNDDLFNCNDSYGAILPQVVVTGTLTRRPVENTWIKTSEAQPDGLGSEFKAMIQCPPGMNMVGAEFDVQMWIGSVMGDASFGGLHGSTASGWIALQGNQSQGTDIHSRVASTLSISRDQAKALNYSRLYGAAEGFTKTLLMKFDDELTTHDAAEAARQLYSITRGDYAYQLNEKGQELVEGLGYTSDGMFTVETLNRMCVSAGLIGKLKHFSVMKIQDLVGGKLWSGGTESEMFNKLEEIARCETPATPLLRSRITRALEPANVGDEFMTSRMSWVVQSTAVDFLHLMLVAMRHLFDVYKIEGRLCISINDQVRYLVKSEDRFRAALALQVAHLWSRSMVAFQLGLQDLPQTVAFLSSVDVDMILRTEADMDCETPSNPYGLKQGYGVPFGQCYDIHKILEKTQGTLEKRRKNHL